MGTSIKSHSTARLAVCASLAGALCFSAVPSIACADTQSDLASARAKLEEIGAQTDKTSSKLQELTDQLTQTQAEVAEKESDLSESQQKLSRFLSSDYKSGGSTLLSALLGTDNLDDMFSKLFYAGKVADSKAEAIEEVKTAKKALESKQSEQEEQVESAQEQVDNLNAQRTEAAALVSSLDAQVKEELQKEAEENARLQSALQASQDSQVEEVDQTQNTTSNSSGTTSSNNASSASSQSSAANTQTNSNASSNTGANTNTSSNTNSGGNTSTNNDSSSTVDGGSVVSRAYSKLGTAYVYGACSPTAFDCSGFVSYCLTGSYTRLGTTYTFLGWTRVSNPQPGDVCTSASHCGIYIGGGQMIHASRPGVGVIIGPVNSDMVYVRR